MKLVIIFLLTIMLIGLASAELIISPNSVEIKAKSGEQSNFTLTLNNTFNFKITNISFSNFTGITYPTITLNPNETKIVNFQLQKTESGIYNFNSIVSFRYSEDIPTGITMHEINISVINCNLDKTVRRLDTIKWKNIDDIDHTISGSFMGNNDISTNQSYSYTFNTIGEFFYSDIVFGGSICGGTISVINETDPYQVHDPNYDKSISMKIEITLNPTNISISTNQNNFTVDATGTQEGLITLQNIGSESAQRIKITSSPNWMNFDKNDFDMTPGQTKYIVYGINPLITKTEDTNKTYNIIIKVKASNSEERNISISVFVPYTNIYSDITTPEGFISFFDRYCKQNPNTIICNNTLSEGSGSNTTIVRDVNIPFNLTATQVYEIMKRINAIENSNDRTNNEIKKLADELGITVPELKNMLNQSIAMQKENENNSVALQRSFWIIVIFVVICVSIFIISKAISKRIKKKNLMMGLK